MTDILAGVVLGAGVVLFVIVVLVVPAVLGVVMWCARPSTTTGHLHPGPAASGPSSSELGSRLDGMASGGFKINPRGIAKMTREIQREFDKHPIRLPVEADAGGIAPPGSGSTNYYGPVVQIQGDGAQLAWGNKSVVQNQVNAPQQIAPGFESIAQAVASTLKQLAAAGLDPQDQADAETAANEVLVEVVRKEPDPGVIRRAITTLKGLLSPVAIGLHTGAADGAQEWATTAIQQLGDAAAAAL